MNFASLPTVSNVVCLRIYSKQVFLDDFFVKGSVGTPNILTVGFNYKWGTTKLICL